MFVWYHIILANHFVTCIMPIGRSYHIWLPHRDNFSEQISSPRPVQGTLNSNFYSMELSEMFDSVNILVLPIVASQLVRENKNLPLETTWTALLCRFAQLSDLTQRYFGWVQTMRLWRGMCIIACIVNPIKTIMPDGKNWCFRSQTFGTK